VSKSRTVKLTMAVCLAMAATTTFAAAQERNIDVQKLQWMPEVRAAIYACMADQSRLCPDVVPGNGRIVRCLAAQGAHLSVGCAAAMQKASDALVAVGVAIAPGLISH
jgi:hypothetical protein